MHFIPFIDVCYFGEDYIFLRLTEGICIQIMGKNGARPLHVCAYKMPDCLHVTETENILEFQWRKNSSINVSNMSTQKYIKRVQSSPEQQNLKKNCKEFWEIVVTLFLIFI